MEAHDAHAEPDASPDPTPPTESRMKALCRQWSEGEISDDELVERITAFTWAPTNQMPPPELKGYDATMWVSNQRPVRYNDDSIDDFSRWAGFYHVPMDLRRRILEARDAARDAARED